jgi:predicted ABC-type ATPase
VTTPNLYIIAGANGSGKTTFAQVFLPKYVRCTRFVNPDLIAQGLSPFAPARAALHAGRLVLTEIRRNLDAGLDFAFETTLSGRTYRRVIQDARARGYRVCLFYLWIPTADLAVARIVDRVAEGGHFVPETDVRRRFKRTLVNLMADYRPLADSLLFFDNAGETPPLVFVEEQGVLSIKDTQRYARIMGRKAQ